MLASHDHGDVTRVVLASPTSRLVGYDVSVYVATTAAGPVLVDTGLPFAWGSLQRYLAARGGGDLARAVRGAVITHRHEDHAGNAARLARAGVPLAMAEATRAAITRPEHLAPYRRYVWGPMAPLPPETVTFDPAPLVLVSTPGHTADHQIVWDPERETLYGGDLFLGVKVRVAHPTEDLRALVRSLRVAASLRPRRFFDAHRGAVADPVARLSAKAAWLDDTIGQVERLLDAGWSVRRVCAAVLDGESVMGMLSGGEYSRTGFVRAVRAGRTDRVAVSGTG